MNPDKWNMTSIGFQDQTVGVVPKTNHMFGKMTNNLSAWIGDKSLYFRCLIDFDISDQSLILHIPNFKFFKSVDNHQVGSHTHFQNPIVHNNRIAPDGE